MVGTRSKRVLAVAALLAGCAADNFVVGDGGSPDGDGGNDAWAQDTGMGDGPAATDGPALCGGAVCNGACVGGTRCLLTANVKDVSCLAVDANYVYYAAKDAMGRVPKVGGAPQGSTLGNAAFAGCTQVSNQFFAADSGGGRIVSLSKGNPTGGLATITSSQAGVTSLAVPVAPQLVWNIAGDLLRTCDYGACGAGMNLVTGVQQPTQIAADGNWVFFGTSGVSPALYRVSRSGGSPSAIVSLPAMATVVSLASPEGSADLFFTTATGFVYVVPKTGNAPLLLGNGKAPTSVRADLSNAFWVDRDSAGTVTRAPRNATGSPTNLLSAVDTPTALEIDGPPDTGFVYYAAKDGIWRVPKQ
jgi:hypothetical protein